MTRINSIKELRESVKRGYHDYLIALNSGLRSSKRILIKEDGTFEILNEIDGTLQNLSEPQLNDKSLTNIGKAIDRGAFYRYI